MILAVIMDTFTKIDEEQRKKDILRQQRMKLKKRSCSALVSENPNATINLKRLEIIENFKNQDNRVKGDKFFKVIQQERRGSCLNDSKNQILEQNDNNLNSVSIGKCMANDLDNDSDNLKVEDPQIKSQSSAKKFFDQIKEPEAEEEHKIDTEDIKSGEREVDDSFSFHDKEEEAKDAQEDSTDKKAESHKNKAKAEESHLTNKESKNHSKSKINSPSPPNSQKSGSEECEKSYEIKVSKLLEKESSNMLMRKSIGSRLLSESDSDAAEEQKSISKSKAIEKMSKNLNLGEAKQREPSSHTYMRKSTMERVMLSKNSSRLRADTNRLYKFFFLISEHPFFNLGIILIILINTVVLSLDRHPISDAEFQTLGNLCAFFWLFLVRDF